MSEDENDLKDEHPCPNCGKAGCGSVAIHEYTDLIDKQNEQLCTLRGLFEFKKAVQHLPIEEVEPASEIAGVTSATAI